MMPAMPALDSRQLRFENEGVYIIVQDSETQTGNEGDFVLLLHVQGPDDDGREGSKEKVGNDADD